MNTKNRYLIILQTLRKENRYSTFLKEIPKFVYRRLLWVKLSAKTKFTTRFKFDNYFSIFLDLL